MKRPQSPRIIFVTGTDTGVGKTVLTSLLLSHLRQAGAHALAMKPFCSGARADVELLHALQAGDLTRDEINPFYFPESLAPLVSARKHRRSIRMHEVVKRIASVLQKLDQISAVPIRAPGSAIQASSWLLIEGSGGLLVPLGEGYSVADLIREVNCEVLIVSRNRLGTINHIMLTGKALQAIGHKDVKVVMMEQARRDSSAHSNPDIIAELLPNCPLFTIPFLNGNPLRAVTSKESAKKIKKTLARILA